MVDLPEVPRRLVTTEAPTSPVSPSDISAPYARLGNALDKVGGVLDDVSVDLAKEAGRNAVTTDDQGNLKVQTLPPIGRAAEAFNRTAQMTYLSRVEGDVKDQILQKRIEFDGRPGDFHDWSNLYASELADKQPSQELNSSVRLLVERHASSAYQGLAIARHTQDVQNNRVAFKNDLDQLDNDAGLLARDGGTGSDEYKGRLADYQARQQQAMTDPTLNYPKSKADADLKDMLARHEVWSVIGGVRRMAEDKSVDDTGAPNGGINKAMDLAESIRTSDKFNLDQDTREKYYRVAVSEIKQLSAENRVLQSQLNTEGQSWVKSIREGNVDAAGVRDFLSRASEAGATRAVAAVIRASALQSWFRYGYSNLPVADRVADANVLQGKSDTRSYMDKVAAVESNNNANAEASTSSAAGLFQYTKGTWLPLVKQARPDLAGKPDDELLALRKDPSVAKQVFAYDEQQTAALLISQGIPVTDRNKYMIHTLGARDGVAVITAPPETPLKGLIWDRAIASNPDLFSRNPTAGSFTAWVGRKMGDAPTLPDAIKNADNQTRLSALSMVQESLKSDLKDTFSTVEKTINAGVTPSAQDMQDLAALVHAVGDDDQKRRMVELGAKVEFGQAFVHASGAEREAMKTQISAQYAAGGQKFVGELNDFASTLNQRVTDAYKNDPYNASVQYGQRPVTPSVVPDDPGGVKAGLDARTSEQLLIRDQQQMQPFSVLRPAEADAWKTTLTRGDVQAGAGFLNSVSQLPQDIYLATMTSKPMADAMSGMAFSRDPQRMEVGLTAMDRVWRTDPHVAEQAFGKAAIDRMQVWQGLRDSHSAAEIAEILNTIDDPARAEARKQLKAAAEKETDKLTPSDVADKFASGFPGLRSITGGVAKAPTDDLQAQELLAEYKTIRTALRTYGVSADNADSLALERLKQAWGPSALNGNQVMQYPPEKYYPQIGGSHAWLNDEISAAAESALGPRFDKKETFFQGDSAVDPSGGENWHVIGIAAAPKSASRIQRGDTPAYSIIVQKKNGQVETVIDKDGRSYVTFDPKSYVDRYENDLRARDANKRFMTSNFGTGQGFAVGSEL